MRKLLALCLILPFLSFGQTDKKEVKKDFKKEGLDLAYHTRTIHLTKD